VDLATIGFKKFGKSFGLTNIRSSVFCIQIGSGLNQAIGSGSGYRRAK
jgi:hypothetical protein